jgi:hypothetical protein
MKKSTCLAGALALGLILPTAGLGASLIYAAKAVTGYEAQILQARAIAGLL